MLTDAQWNVLRAAADRIIPPDEDPGAWEAGVGDYLKCQFTRDLEPALPLYREGLEALEAEAQAQFGAGFAALEAGQQDTLLRAVEAGTVRTEWPTPPAAFFRQMVNHVAEGYYSDPDNGGNRNAVAWQMVGFRP